MNNYSWLQPETEFSHSKHIYMNILSYISQLYPFMSLQLCSAAHLSAWQRTSERWFGSFHFCSLWYDRYLVTSPAPSMNQNMAAAMELRCWGGDWGLPSVHSESLVVLVKSSSPSNKEKIRLRHPGLLLRRKASSAGFLCGCSVYLWLASMLTHPLQFAC